jgi:ribonucleotide reductase alpha subunit
LRHAAVTSIALTGTISLLAGEASDPEPLLQGLRATGHLPDDAPSGLCRLFATAHEISPESRIGMQTAFQQYTDTAVSKTINLPNRAQPGDIAAAYRWRSRPDARASPYSAMAARTARCCRPERPLRAARNAASRW